MKVEINVDECQFKEILEKEIKDLPKDIIKEIIVESIRGYFQQDNYKSIQEIFLKEDGYSYSRELTANALLRDIIRNCDYSELQSVVDEAIRDLKENHDRILMNVLKDCIVKGLAETYSFNYTLEETIRRDLFEYHNRSA